MNVFLIGFSFFLAMTGALAHPEVDEQIAAVTRGIERESDNAVLYLRRGELHRVHQDWKRALADYDRAEQLDSSLVGVDKARGQMFLDAGQPKQALLPLSRFLQRLPDNADGLALRACAWAALKDTEAAVADYSAAVTNATESAVEYYVERAKLLAPVHPDEAVRGLDEGIARLGPVGTLEATAISLRVAQGRYDDALGRLDVILARVSRKETFLLQRGQILEKAGRFREATGSYRQALAAIKALPPYCRHVRAVADLEVSANEALRRMEQQAKKEMRDARR